MDGWEIINEYKHDPKNMQVSQILGTGVPQCGNPYLDILLQVPVYNTEEGQPSQQLAV